jgi:hypothetical protein
MNKIVTVIAMASVTIISTASAIESCDEWFAKNEFGIAGAMGKDGMGVMLDKAGELEKVFASGVAFYDFDDGGEVTDALKEASMAAKANLSKYMEEEISSDESIDKITSKKKEMSKDANGSDVNVLKKSVTIQTMNIKTHSSALLTGVIKICESNDAGKKEVQVVLAVSPKTAASASKVADAINKEIGNRKSVEEYAAERSAGSASTQSSSVPNAPKTPSGTAVPADSSFSNKAKNMNF